VATATSGADPTIMLTGPTPATRRRWRAGLTVDDIDLFELNEAFASVVLKFQKDLKIPTRSSTSTVAPSRWATRWAPPAP
jgi:acetyl-CoA C-acetyltransferase